MIRRSPRRPASRSAGVLLAALALAAAPRLAAAQEWRFHAGVGVAYNLPAAIAIAQDGEPELSLTARWATRPFRTPLYYVGRLERVDGARGLGLELIHHKLFLENAPVDVQHFEISHGFNVVTLQRAWLRADGVSWRAGAGVVVTHPETIVRERRQPRGGWGSRGYYVSGPAAQLAAGWSRRLVGRARWGVEGKLIGAHASVPIAGGSAHLWHASAHLDALVSVGR
ncbi:MAG: hypothetical protein EXR95_05745 [Gemmatimonadetes bacterium]|nr:hypothetical protein [Gemmatimonadota bacterium]